MDLPINALSPSDQHYLALQLYEHVANLDKAYMAVYHELRRAKQTTAASKWMTRKYQSLAILNATIATLESSEGE
jgi:hypothetical protein